MAEQTPEREALLARIDPLQAEIVRLKNELDETYQRRADVFLSIQEADPKMPVKAMADRAKVTGPAVSQQIDKAIERRRQAENPDALSQVQAS